MIGVDFLAVFYRHDHSADNYSCMLFRLIAKADERNIFLLSRVYPAHVGLYKWWRAQPQQPTTAQVCEKGAELEHFTSLREN